MTRCPEIKPRAASDFEVLIFRARFLGELLLETRQRFLQSPAADSQNLRRQQPRIFYAAADYRPEGRAAHTTLNQDNLKPSVPAMHHKYHQGAVAENAGQENKHDDG